MIQNKDTITLAKAIIDNHIHEDVDYNTELTEYSCLFCNSNIITTWGDNKPKPSDEDIVHESSCPVVLSKTILKNILGGNESM